LVEALIGWSATFCIIFVIRSQKFSAVLWPGIVVSHQKTQWLLCDNFCSWLSLLNFKHNDPCHRTKVEIDFGDCSSIFFLKQETPKCKMRVSVFGTWSFLLDLLCGILQIVPTTLLTSILPWPTLFILNTRLFGIVVRVSVYAMTVFTFVFPALWDLLDKT
jgi:hypothetical protein